MGAPWATRQQVQDRVPLAAPVDVAKLDAAILYASDVLAGLAPGRGPATSVTVVPGGCECGVLLTGPYDRVDQGAAGVAGASPFWWRVGADLVVGDRGCGHALRLGGAVAEVTQVVVDDEVQDPSTYALWDSDLLVRQGGATWTAKPLSAGGGVRVSYTTGGLDEGALRAVAALAAELYKNATGQPCALPQRVQTITRAGVTLAMLDPQEYLDDGRTGVYLVDLWLASTRRPRAGVSVISPDTPRMHTVRSAP